MKPLLLNKIKHRYKLYLNTEHAHQNNEFVSIHLYGVKIIQTTFKSLTGLISFCSKCFSIINLGFYFDCNLQLLVIIKSMDKHY